MAFPPKPNGSTNINCDGGMDKIKKKSRKYLVDTIKVCTFALAYEERGSVAQLNRALDYGSRGSGFESQRSQFESQRSHSSGKRQRMAP